MQWWQKNMHDGFRFVMLLQSAYMWATMVFIKKGAPNQTSSCMDANCKPFQALKEASSRLCTYTHTWDQIHTFLLLLCPCTYCWLEKVRGLWQISECAPHAGYHWLLCERLLYILISWYNGSGECKKAPCKTMQWWKTFCDDHVF
jgi:hypothetical protein